jgi:hypothetical protein
MQAQILAALAGYSMAAWLGAFLLAVWVTRPRLRPDPTPIDEPPVDPAIAALLCPPNGRLPRRAATATLWDLVARGVLTAWIDREGHCWVRPEPTAQSATLTPYERHVLRQVSSRATTGSGVVPAAALGPPPGEPEGRWHTEFTQLVVEAARHRGLVGVRAAPALRVLLGLGLLVPTAFAIAALLAAGAGGAVVITAIVPVVPLVVSEAILGPLVPVGDGRTAAARCLALRATLTGRALAGPPSPGDRLDGYAVALAGAGTGPLTLSGAGRDTAWSSRGGEWRPIRIRPAHRSTVTRAPGPVRLFLISLGAAVFFGGSMAILILLCRAAVGHRTGWIWLLALLGAAWLAWGLGGWRAGRAIYRELYDARHPARVVEGQVVHIEYHVGSEASSLAIAIDDGTGDDIALYQVDPSLYPKIAYGSQVRVELMPRTGRTLRAEPIAAIEPIAATGHRDADPDPVAD